MDGRPDATASTGASTAVPTVKAHADKPLTDRWLDLKTFSHGERFRSEYNFGDAHLFEGGQERSIIQGRVKLDASDHYSIGFRAFTGHYFNWAYSDFAGASEAHRVGAGDLGRSFAGTPFRRSGPRLWPPTRAVSFYSPTLRQAGELPFANSTSALAL